LPYIIRAHLPFTIWTFANDIIIGQGQNEPNRLSICCVCFHWVHLPLYRQWGIGPKSWLTKICGQPFAIFVSAIHCGPFFVQLPSGSRNQSGAQGARNVPGSQRARRGTDRKKEKGQHKWSTHYEFNENSRTEQTQQRVFGSGA